LNPSAPLNIQLLESTLHALNTSSDASVRTRADQVLTALKESPNAWESAGQMLEQSQDTATRYFALQVLEDTIKFRWKALPQDQREGIRNYVVQKIIDTSSTETVNAAGKTFLFKLNVTLVQILKQEWPGNWPNFIPEIVASSQRSEILCENNMQILKILSEEIFDFSKEEMTTNKVLSMKERLNSEFREIFKLCQLVLNESTRPQLVTATLQTLLRFLGWIPYGFVFETPLIEQLLNKFLMVPTFRNDTLACLTDIAAVEQPKYNQFFGKIFEGVMALLEQQLPPKTDIPLEYDRADESDQQFIRNLCIFLCTFFSKHLNLLEESYQELLHPAMFYLISISMVNDDDIFKICLEFWNVFTSSLYEQVEDKNKPEQNARVNLYRFVLSRVRSVMISRMAKPEEVLIVEDEDGAIVLEVDKDTDAIAQYKLMRETLICACYFDPSDCEKIMIDKLAMQCDQTSGEFSWHNLNTLCWAIGSISGAMNVDDEKRVLVTVIKDLLLLVEIKRGKDNKAVVASNIMYVVGQYPRFLHAHWKFLKTVVKKLFEFMHELHPGVQDMACDTFLKISQKCKSQFVMLQPEENQPYIEELLDQMADNVRDLKPHQRHRFLEAMGYMIGEEGNQNRQEQLLARLMQPSNKQWTDLMRLGNENKQAFSDYTHAQLLADILRVNIRVCSAMGYSFRPQMMNIYLDMLHVYQFYSSTIARAVAEGGDVVAKHKEAKVMNVVKVSILKLIESFVKSADPDDIGANFCTPLFEPVLRDYQAGLPVTRTPEVLELLKVIVERLGPKTEQLSVENILGPVFMPTLEMITTNFVDFQDHRLSFYKLILVLCKNAFAPLFNMPADTQKSIIDAIVWAFKHTERNVSETGCDILECVLKSIAAAPKEIMDSFYSRFFLTILQDILYVLTDRLHKALVANHAAILQLLFQAAQKDTTVNLSPDGTQNVVFLTQHVSNMLVSAFPNIGLSVAQEFVKGMFTPMDKNLFKTHVRDFLVRMREFSADDDVNQLYLQEKEEEQRRAKELQRQQKAAIPGLLTEEERAEMEEL